jgi:hypothetical protein
MCADVETCVRHGIGSSEESIQRRGYRRGPCSSIGQLSPIEDEDLGPDDSVGAR